MVQNHMLQVLALTAMEPPVSLESESIRDEKVKLLKSIRALSPLDVARQVVRGQYFAGAVDGTPAPGYRQEPKVRQNSNVETYVALKLFIDNWRWSGVPFYLRTGKYLPQSASEARIQFRPTPHVLFAAECGQNLDANSLALRFQPNEGIYLRFNGKVPGVSVSVRPVRMNFSYDAEYGAYTPEAYERLLLDALVGDSTLFIRRDEVETAWQIVDSIRAAWEGKPLTNREFYAAGTWGPVASDDLLAQSGHIWHEPHTSNVSSPIQSKPRFPLIPNKIISILCKTLNSFPSPAPTNWLKTLPARGWTKSRRPTTRPDRIASRFPAGASR
jgi:glucose-6-phosphate 1-dehydrogenase